jgi:hypothetical protein
MPVPDQEFYAVRDKCEQFRAALEDVVETLEAMDLHVDNPLYERTRKVLEE